MWKKLIWCNATLLGCYYLWSNKNIKCHSKYSTKDDFEDGGAFIYLSESADFFDDDMEYRRLSLEKNISKLKKLLSLSKSKKQSVRHKAIQSIAELSNLEDWQYKIISQSSDPRMAIALARLPQTHSTMLLSSPFDYVERDTLSENLCQLLESLLILDSDVCTKFLTGRAKSLALHVLKKYEDKNLELDDYFVTFHSENKKKEVLEFDQLCLEALLAHSSIKEHRKILLDKGILNLLFTLCMYHQNNRTVQSFIAQIIANLTLEVAFHNSFHNTGWIKILSSMSKSPYIEISLPSSKALANLDEDDFQHFYYDHGVYLLHPTFRHNKKNYPADIIFIHGLLGGTFWTWRQHDSMKKCSDAVKKGTNLPATMQTLAAAQSYTYCWPKDWLPADFPDARIISVDYNTCISKWKATCPQLEEKDSLHAKARNLIEKLLISKLGERPIIWIAHSMGGLLVKEILLQAANSEDTNVKSIAEKSVGIIFFSVPHKGSDCGKIFHSFPYIFQPSIDLKHLQKDSSVLQSLNTKFIDVIQKHKIPVLSFGETHKSRWGLTLSLLVSEESSNPGIGEFYALPADHLSTCKPKSRESNEYIKIVDFLHKTIPYSISLPYKYSKTELEISNLLSLIH